MPRIFFIIVMLCIACSYTFAQTGSLQIALGTLPELKDSTRHLKPEIYIMKSDGDQNNAVADTELLDWAADVRIDGLAPGTYNITVAGKCIGVCCIPGYRYYLKKVMVPGIVVTAGKAAPVSVTFPAPCQYYKDFTHRECPKCHKSDQVVPNVWGDPVVDPETGKIPYEDEMHWVMDHDPTGCDPIWYCKRDSFEF